MEMNRKLFLIITAVILQGDGVSLRRQSEPNARRNFYKYDPRELSPILGVPSMPSHLPEAEPILPGQTLLKPAMGMLKSSVKFPHRDFEDGSGVYGNMDNIGIRYDAKNERVLYSGFRRMPSNYIVMAPHEPENSATKFPVSSAPLNLDMKSARKIVKLLEKLKMRKPRIYIPKITQVYPENFGKNRIQLIPTKKNLRWDTDKDTDNFDFSNDYGIDDDMELNKEKKALLYDNEYPFDHVVINSNAPEFSDLFPTLMKERGREWWFYNGMDYPLNANREYRRHKDYKIRK